MAANTTPIFVLTPKVGNCIVTTANATASVNHLGTGTLGTDIQLGFTAGTNGSRVDRIYIRALGTNVASVARIFVNNGSVNTTQGNNSLFKEVALTASTISETTIMSEYDLIYSDGLFLPASYRILVAVGTSIAAGIAVTIFGGDY